jgi:hypothetical protein
MTSVQASRFIPVGVNRGPLWRRSAFRSAMNGWRDFVLRELFCAMRTVGQVAPNEFAKPIKVSREQG